MLKISQSMQDALLASTILDQVHRAFYESLPGFSSESQDDQAEFTLFAQALANDSNMKSTMGIAAFGLAAWWLGPDFMDSSAGLREALRTDLPEIRKVHMLNEWAAVRIAQPTEMAPAERALVQARAESRAWGER